MAEAKKKLHGTFCDMTKYGGEGWGVQIEEDGDIAPGQEIDVRRKDGETKPITIDDIVYEDPWKVVCSVRRDPADKPANARKGAAKRRGAVDVSDGRDGNDPRPARRGTARFSGKFIDLGGTRIKAGLIDFDALLDL